MPVASVLDVLAAAIGANQVDGCRVVVPLYGGAVDSLLRRDAEFGPREDAQPAPAPQQPAAAQPQDMPQDL